MPKYHLIYERNGNIWISTFPYDGWEAIQNAFEDYMASLEFSSMDELREFLRDEYRLSQKQLDLSIEKFKAESHEPQQIRLQGL